MKLTFRPACREDAAKLLEWRNDPNTRSMSKNDHAVEWCQHLQWLDARLARREPKLFVGELDGSLVCTYRIDGDEISYTVAPDQRGRGVCSAMLHYVVNTHGSMKAEIFERNVASIKAATRTGLQVLLI